MLQLSLVATEKSLFYSKAVSQRDKLVVRLKAKPKDFTWQELVRLLTAFGYAEAKRGKTGGSRRRFVHPTAALITLHKPHPGSILKQYQVEQIIETLTQEGFL
jgi:predicted RNA binding protein YcfA (HicA-like mRNA interferase family)